MDENERNDLMQQKQQEIINLTNNLTSPYSEIGDYKMLKILEANLAGEEAPYDFAALHQARQQVREKIDQLRAEIEDLKG